MARITWQNVNGSSLADASRPLEAASRSFDRTFQILNQALEERQAFDAGVRTRQEEGRVQSILDRVQGAQTPEQLAALQASGELAAARAGLVNPASRSRVRGVEEQRNAALQQKYVTDKAFSDRLDIEREKPFLTQFNSILAQGDLEAAEGWLAANGQNLRDASVAQKQLSDARRTATLRGREDEKWKTERALDELRVMREQAERERDPLVRQQLEASIAASRAQISAATAAQKRLDSEAESARKAAEANAAAELLKSTGNPLAVSGVFDVNQTPVLLKELKDSGVSLSDDQLALLAQRMGRLTSFPVKYTKPGTNQVVVENVPVPMSTIRQALLGTEQRWDNGFFNDESFANRFEDQVRAGMSRYRPVTATAPDGKKMVYQVPEAVFDAEAYFGAQLGRATNPGTGKRR